jgi:hypothetical protein
MYFATQVRVVGLEIVITFRFPCKPTADNTCIIITKDVDFQ